MKRRRSVAALAPLAVVVGLSVLVILAAKSSPLAAFGALFQGSFGSTEAIAETLTQSTVLLFAALGVAIAFRAGLFNIGAEGQLVVGALCAAVVGAAIHLPKPLELTFCFLAGAFGGGVWGSLAGWLKARFGASEVITTIMLNYVAYLGANYLVAGPLRGSASAPETALIAPSAMLHPIIPFTRLTAAFPLAIVAAVAAWWWLARTIAGFELRTLGRSERAAHYAGVNVSLTIMRTMALSGALAGLGGASEVVGMLHRFNAELSPGYGFTAIAAALLAGSNPLATIVTSVFFGALQNGALSMQALAGVPKDLISVIVGLVIVFVAINRFGQRASLHGPVVEEAATRDEPLAEGAT